jgi:hypothetical protein
VAPRRGERFGEGERQQHPRQTGKSPLLARLEPGATWLSLDDVQVRLQAEQDPALLLDVGGGAEGGGIVLDEAAYAPHLFSGPDGER